MNGWQRLFVLSAALFIVLAAGFLTWAHPGESESFYAGECGGAGYYTVAEAIAAIAEEKTRAVERPWAKYSSDMSRYSDAELTEFAEAKRAISECVADLDSIASGQRLADKRARWLKDVRTAALAIGLILTATYAIGWGLGWVWRGFFPKQPGNDGRGVAP